MNTQTDHECHQLLTTLRELSARADTLSTRLDSTRPAIGALWGVTRSLRTALDHLETVIDNRE